MSPFMDPVYDYYPTYVSFTPNYAE